MLLLNIVSIGTGLEFSIVCDRSTGAKFTCWTVIVGTVGTVIRGMFGVDIVLTTSFRQSRFSGLRYTPIVIASAVGEISGAPGTVICAGASGVFGPRMIAFFHSTSDTGSDQYFVISASTKVS